MAEGGIRLFSSFFLVFPLCWTSWNVISAQETAAPEGQCVMYGQCGEGDYGSLNCVYNGPPKPIQDKNAINILKDICPEFVQDDKALTCCDPLQLEAMESNFKLPARLLNRCPSCFANFRKNFCRLTCSPVQSRYLHVTETQKNDEGKDMISQITYYMTERFASGLFESCQNVEGIIPGTRVIEMMCGSWSKKCTGPRWLQFMGSTPDNQGFSPFQINYTLVKENQTEEGGVTYYPMDDPAFKCSEAPTPNDKICSCSDCQASCNRELIERKTSTSSTPFSTTTATTRASSAVTSTTSSTITTRATTTTTNSDELTTVSNIGTKRIPTEESPKQNYDEIKSDNLNGSESSLSTKINNKLFRRILSPLIVIAPAFGDN